MRADKDKEVSWFSLKRVTFRGGEECHPECPFFRALKGVRCVCQLFGELEVDVEATANKDLPRHEWMGVKRHQACKDCMPVRTGLYQNR